MDFYLTQAEVTNALMDHSLFYERRPMYVCPLCWRPAFEEKGKASLMDFVWTIWDSKDSDVTKYVPLKKPV